jgi:hypothetical protein
MRTRFRPFALAFAVTAMVLVGAACDKEKPKDSGPPTRTTDTGAVETVEPS